MVVVAFARDLRLGSDHHKGRFPVIPVQDVQQESRNSDWGASHTCFGRDQVRPLVAVCLAAQPQLIVARGLDYSKWRDTILRQSRLPNNSLREKALLESLGGFRRSLINCRQRRKGCPQNSQRPVRSAETELAD